MHNPLPLQLAAQAEAIVDTVEDTDYQHNQVIDPDSNTYLCDCSEFVGFILQALAPAHYAMVPVEPGHVRARAFEYYEFLAAQTSNSSSNWNRIERLADARRGDILAWRFPIIEIGHDTGHVVYLAETPIQNPDGTFTVRVYDSAAQPHFHDTRGPGADQFASGVGSGFISFQVDPEGEPTAFLFAPGDHFVTLPIAIARTEPLSSD